MSLNVPPELTFLPLARQHARAVAELHVAGIPTGFISSLGLDFVTTLYEAIADGRGSFGFVALADGRVAGYTSATSSLKGLYLAVLRRAGLKFSLLLARRALAPRTLKRILETLFYPQRTRNLQLPEAEILAGVVAPEVRGYGVANQLFALALEECRRRGIKEVKIAAAETLQHVNKIYQLLGLQVRAKILNHGVATNIYVMPTELFGSGPPGHQKPKGA
jgi:ribosomal protein S18 acetylase RimI-like enzyme